MDIVKNETAAATFNLADFEAKDTAWLIIKNKQNNGPLMFNGQPVRIEVRSPGTREAVSAQHEREQATTARTVAAMSGKPAVQTVDDKIAEKATRLAAVTALIDNFPVDAKALYANPKLGYITAQVEEFHFDWANF